jgi:EmrB/QacA subfamily drug resistance transporter
MTDAEKIYARRWWTHGVLCLSLIIVSIANSSLNVAIPVLSRELHATTSQLQWVIAAYALVFSGLLFSAGAIGDRFGRKGALQVGLVGFLAGVAFAAAATSMWQLVLARAFMGACAAFIMPSTLSILVNVFPPGERAKAIAVWAGVTGGAGTLGPIASGWVLNHYWYGAVFLVNVPVVLIALGLGVVLVPKSKDPDEADLDLVGAALSVVGISSVVFGLIQGPGKGWTSAGTLGAFAVGALGLVAFVLYERRAAHPMLDMAYFRNPAFSTATGGMILVFLAMYGMMFMLTQYLQLTLGFSAFSTSLRFLPMAPIMLVIAPMTPRIAGRIGANRTVAMGMGLVSLGFLSFSTLGVHSGYPHVLTCFMVLIAGIALTMSPLTASIMSAVPANKAGSGSAMNDSTRELGAALGVAVLGSVAASRYSSGISDVVGRLSPADGAAASRSLGGALEAAKHLPASLQGDLVSAANSAFVSGIHVAAIIGCVSAATAAVLVLRFLPAQSSHHGAMRDAVGATEDMAELGLGGTPPIFADSGAGSPR